MHFGIGHNRPPEPEKPLTPIGRQRDVKDVMDLIPYKFIAAIEDNEKLKPCCRKAKDHKFQLFKTDPDFKKPDVAIFTCNCGNRHIRMAAGSGKIA